MLPTIQPEGWLDDPELRAFVRADGTSKAAGAIVKVAAGDEVEDEGLPGEPPEHPAEDERAVGGVLVPGYDPVAGVAVVLVAPELFDRLRPVGDG